MHMLHTGYNLQHYLKMSQMVIVSQIELKKDLLTERNERKFTCVLHYIFNYREIRLHFTLTLNLTLIYLTRKLIIIFIRLRGSETH